MMGVNLRGEMKMALKEEVSLKDITLIGQLAESMRLSSREVSISEI